MAAADTSPVVRMYLASAAQRIAAERRWELMINLVSHAADADDQNLPYLYWYAIEPLVGLDRQRAVQLASKAKIPKLRQLIARRVAAQ